MLNSKLLQEYISAFGHTFTVDLWDQRPGTRINQLMRAALAGQGPIVTDKLIAEELATRSGPDGTPPE